MNYFHLEETLSRDELKELQLRKLKHQVGRCYENVPYYRAKFDAAGLKPAHIQRLTDITKIPFTTKDDLRHFYPDGLLAVPLEKAAHYHLTSGTTGTPVTIGYTAADWERSAQLMGRILACQGLRPGELLYQSYGYGLWAGGPVAEGGAKAMGARVLPVGGGRTSAAVQWIRDFRVRAITCTPSFMVHLVETALKEGIDPQKDWTLLKLGIHGAESWSRGLRDKIEAALPEGFRAYNIYGMTEAGGPMVAANCPVSYEESCMHVWADAFLLEIVDPETGEPVAPGQEGELVMTTLDREAAPMLRFRTRDLTAFKENPYDCPCGRGGHPLIKHIVSRLDDVLKVRGTMVAPGRIEDIISRICGVGDMWLFLVDREEGKMDRLTIQFEATPSFGADPEMKHALAKQVVQKVTDAIGLRVEVDLLPPGTLIRFEGKAKRVIDRRVKQ